MGDRMKLSPSAPLCQLISLGISPPSPVSASTPSDAVSSTETPVSTSSRTVATLEPWRQNPLPPASPSDIKSLRLRTKILKAKLQTVLLNYVQRERARGLWPMTAQLRATTRSITTAHMMSVPNFSNWGRAELGRSPNNVGPVETGNCVRPSYA